LIAGIVVITIALSLFLNERNMLYVIVSGSMSPAINQNDMIVVNGLVPFQSLQEGDIIVFNSPDGISGVITHRVMHLSQSQHGLYAVTKGDANQFAIPDVDYPVTDKELIGKVALTIPAGGEIVKLIRPPTAYIMVVGIIGILSCAMVTLHGRKEGMKPRG
jgi:signal peptidase I